MAFNDIDSKSFDIAAKTFRGLEEVLAGEIGKIGGKNIRKGNRIVFFRGNKDILYRSNFHLRTALRILKPFYDFRARNENELYKGATGYDWSQLISGDATFAIDSVLNSPWFNHSGYVALKVKDAIVDQFRAKTGIRPDVDTSDPDIRIHLHISGDRCSLLLDSSGESLHKRGYRVESGPAPLNEVLAAGLIYLTGWDKRSVLFDPMCGSGTIPVEAAMLAHNIPPGIYRKQFAFEKWPDFDEELFHGIYNEELPQPDYQPQITGADISSGAVQLARKNSKSAFPGKKIDFRVSSFGEIHPSGSGGVIIMNPPYGERLGNKENLRAFYTSVGDILKNKFDGYTVWILSSNIEALKYIGLRPESKIILFNGPLECRFVKFTIYRGSKKAKKQIKQ